MIAITIIIAVILTPVVVLTAFFAMEVLAGVRKMNSQRGDPRDVRAVVVIPAHNEEAVIGRTIANIAIQEGADFPVMVVADNCSDRTAQAARTCGVHVVVRDEPDRRGKGFALAAAREHLRNHPPDVVVVIDADCQFDAGGLLALVAVAAGSQRPCQAVNLLAPDLAGPPLVQISTFAFMIKNLVRQRGLQRLAGRAHLTGTGMALPWTIFDTAHLGGSNIVEDLALGLDLAERASPPLLVEGATVWSLPASFDGTLVQRRRWEGGYLATALKVAPAALMRAVLRRDVHALCAALDLAVPPLALLVLMNAAGFFCATAAAFVGAAVWPLILQVAVGIAALAALILAWSREGQRFAAGRTLLRIPFYLLWKVPLYVGLARRGAPKEWLRSGR